MTAFDSMPSAFVLVPRRCVWWAGDAKIDYDLDRTPRATRIARSGRRWAAWASLSGDGDWRELPWFHIGTYRRRRRAERELGLFVASIGG